MFFIYQPFFDTFFKTSTVLILNEHCAEHYFCKLLGDYQPCENAESPRYPKTILSIGSLAV